MPNPIPPSKIADDMNNNLSYWLYTADDNKTADAMKNIAKLNNFDFVNNIDITLLNDNQEQLKQAVKSIITDEATYPIFLIYDNVAKVVYYDPTPTAGYNDGVLGTDTGYSLTTLDNTVFVNAESTTARFAIFIKENSDKTSKYDLLENQIKNNVVTVENQHGALVYMYVFLIIISILSLMFNYDKIKLTHIVFLIFFIFYGFFYQHISTFIVMQFKDVMVSIKSTDSTNQLIQYIKLVLLVSIAFFVPLLSLMLFNTSYDVQLSDATDYTKSIIDGAVDYTSGLVDSSKDTLNDGISNISENVGNVQNSVNDVVGSVSDTVGNIGETVSNSVNTISDQVSDGFNRVTPVSSANPPPATAPPQA